MVRFSISTKRRLLSAANIAMAAAVVICIGSCFISSDVGAQNLSRSGTAGTIASSANETQPPLEEYAVIYSRDLRKPVFDIKPPDPIKVEPPKPKFKATLTGTVLEPGFTYALFRTSSGEDKLISVGQSIEDAEVTAIESETVTLNFHGDVLKLTVKQDGDKK